MLLFYDSFDHYTSAVQKWSSVAGSGVPGMVAGSGRNGTAGFDFSTAGALATKTLPGQYATLICGFAFRRNTTPSSTGVLFRFQEGASTVHVDLRVTPLGQLEVTRSGTLLGSGTTVIPINVFAYIEIKATIHDTTGAVEVRVNGVTDINVSGVDTRNGGTGLLDVISLVRSNPGVTDFWIDDLYVIDTTDSGVAGVPNNDFLGDVRVEYLAPNGNGNSSQFVGSDADSTDNFLLVDEAPSDGDTTYVGSPTVGNKDTYAYGNLTPTTGTVFGVQILPMARKTDAGTRSLATVARLGVTETDGPTRPLSTSYQYLSDIREANPDGDAWDIADVNGAEFGVKVAA